MNHLLFPTANAIRALSMDAVQNAESGHPGMPMGMAEVAVALWQRHLRHNPLNPDWMNRDRFVLSNGHGSMLQYSLLHLTGYDVSIDDLKAFRQLHSKTPGHPEVGYTPGVEVSTGPLGQGLANAVGMALAEKMLAAEFNREGFEVVDHHTYVFVGDGCLMEGISHEACSFAGTLGLGKLVTIYDDNGISIDGHVDAWFTDDTAARFESYGWHVIRNVDGHDIDAVAKAIQEAKADRQRPSLICCKTTIGLGAPTKANSPDCHGSPLGKDEIARAREALNWMHEPFKVPPEIYEQWDAKARGAELERSWSALFKKYSETYPVEAAELARRTEGRLPDDFDKLASDFLNSTAERAETIATRKSSQNAIEFFAAHLPELVGGSADLASSNLTMWSKAKPVHTDDASGNYVYYGVREFAMAAMINGMVLHKGYRPFGGTFLMFSEYARNALRMASLMKINPIHIFTHDSIALGQDGPTHQPVEQLATLRMIPNMDVWRPCDTFEASVAWEVAIESVATPTCLVLSRQNLQFQERSPATQTNVRKGGYILEKERGALDAVLIATGSEVELAVAAGEALEAEGIHVRVVSMPSTFQFEKQDAEYQAEVIPEGVPRVAVEAGVTSYWRQYVGLSGQVVGIDSFGESAPAEVLLNHFGFTKDRVLSAVKKVVKQPQLA